MLWGGRFKKGLDEKALKFSSSLNVDINLLQEDIEGSIAQALMLGEIKLLTSEETQDLVNGLNKILEEWKNGNWIPSENEFEDVHSAVEKRLYEIIGDTAGKLHTGRSRNDQVATDIKLWIRKSCNDLIDTISKFQISLLDIAKENIKTIIPGYTHLQRAQPISLAFHLLAYVEMLNRDSERFAFVKNSVNESPLGAGALAGSTIPLDRDFTSKKLGFDSPTRNALDTVSNRDFLIDFLNACLVSMMHLSRLSEEIILWSTSEWNFIKLSDEYSTGSSLMPQKKNPDIAELIRGKSGRVYGNYISLTTTLKSLPLSYNRDLQEDKEPVFDSYSTLRNSLLLMSEMLKTASFNKDRFAKELEGDFSLATDLADWLVLKGVPFRDAHHIVGEVVKVLEEKNQNFKGADLSLLKSVNEIFDETAMECFNIGSSLKRKKSYGSPSPSEVEKQIKFWTEKLN